MALKASDGYKSGKKSRRWKQVSVKSNAATKADPSKKINNYLNKFDAVGVDVNKALDDRNGVEKFLNLRQSQGILGDTLELLDRPRNAISNIITDKNVDTGTGKDFLSGLSGKAQSSGKDLLGSLTGKDPKDIGFWAGLGTEIVTDPLNLVLPIGVTDDLVRGGSKIAWKGVDRMLGEGVVAGGKLAAKPVKALGKKVLSESAQESIAKVGKEIGNVFDYTKAMPKNVYNKVKELSGTKTMAQKLQFGTLGDIEKTVGRDTMNKAGKIIANKAGNNIGSGDIVEKLLNNYANHKEASFLLEDMPTKDVNSLIKHLNKSYGMGERPFVVNKIMPSLKDTPNAPTGWKIELLDDELIPTLKSDLGEARKLRDTLPEDAKYFTEGSQSVEPLNTPVEITDIDRINIARKLKKENVTDPELLASRTAEEIEKLTARRTEDLIPSPWKREELLNRNIELPRQALDFEITPELQKVADRIEGLQGEIRKFMEDNGFKIGNKAGYVHKLLDASSNLETSTLKKSGFLGSPKSFQESMYEMSPWAANKALGLPLFEEDVFKIMHDSIRTVTEQVEKLGVFKEALQSDAIQFINRKKDQFDFDEAIADGKIVIDNIGDFRNKFDFIKNQSDLPEVFEKLKAGEAIVVDKAVADLITFDKARKSDMSELFKWHDKLMGAWKGTKLLSTGYHVRNYVGNATNMLLAGMPVQDIVTFQGRAMKDYWLFEEKILPKLAKGDLKTLTSSERKIFDDVVEFSKSGLISDTKVRSEMKEVMDQFAGEGVDPNMFQKLLKMNYHVGQFVDDFNRLATWRWAKKNFSDVGLKSSDEAADFVRYALFDYADLSNFENKYLKKIFPFYTFAKKNAAFQVQNMLKNPKKYANINKAVTGAQEEFGLNSENLPDYAEKGMWIPMYTDKNGTIKMMKLNLPQGEAGQLLEHPIKTLVTSTSPLVKSLFELNANQRFFSGQPITEFEGQQVDENRFVKNPVADYLMDEYLGGVTDKGTQALDTAEQVLGKPIGRKNMSDNYRLLPSVEANLNPETTALSNQYDKLAKLEELYKQYQQATGKKLPTTSQLKTWNIK